MKAKQIQHIVKSIGSCKRGSSKAIFKRERAKRKMQELDKLNISLNINEKEKQVLDTSNEKEEQKKI